MMEKLLSLRNERKAKKPTFTRSDSHSKKRVGTKWRRPRGLQSKVRLEKKGYVRKPKVGWGSPRQVKGLTRKGLKEKLVSTVADLDKVDVQKEGIVISSGVGTRKKVGIVKKAIELKITILNLKDSQSYLKKVEEKFTEKKKEKEKKIEEKEKKEKEKAVKKKEKEKKEPPSDELTAKIEQEEKKKEEKKEKDKLLIKKDSI